MAAVGRGLHRAKRGVARFEARVAAVERVLGLAHNAPFAAPAVAGAIAEVAEQPGRLA